VRGPEKEPYPLRHDPQHGQAAVAKVQPTEDEGRVLSDGRSQCGPPGDQYERRSEPQQKIGRKQGDHARAPRAAILDDRELGDDQEAQEDDTVFLAQRSGRQQEEQPRAVADGELGAPSRPKIKPQTQTHDQRGCELGLPDHVADGLHVDRVHGEDRGGGPGAGERKELECKPEYHQCEGDVQRDIDRMENPRGAVSDHPLKREGHESERAVQRAAVLSRPVPLDEVEPKPGEGVDLWIVPDDEDVVVSEAVRKARRAGAERQDDERADQEGSH